MEKAKKISRDPNVKLYTSGFCIVARTFKAVIAAKCYFCFVHFITLSDFHILFLQVQILWRPGSRRRLRDSF